MSPASHVKACKGHVFIYRLLCGLWTINASQLAVKMNWFG